MNARICRCCGNALIENSAENPNICVDCARMEFADGSTPSAGGAQQTLPPGSALGEQISGNPDQPGTGNGDMHSGDA